MSKKKEMTAQESLAAAQEYYRLMRGGVPSDEAFKRAYPGGIPSQQDRLKAQAKEDQNAAFAGVGGQVAGTAAGVYGASKLASALAGGKEAAKAGADAAQAASQATNAAQATQVALAGNIATSGAPYSQAGMAGAQQGLGPLADLGIGGSSPASGAMAQMGGVPAETMGAAPGYAYALPAVAAALAGRYGIRALQGKTEAWQDASAADNAGRAILAMGTFGGSELVNALGGRFGGDKNRWQTERNRLEQLKEQGFTGLPDYSALSGGRSKEELVQLAKDTGGNVEFAQTRSEGALTPQDIVGYASIIERAGKDASIDDRLKLAASALAANAVREHHGTIDVDWSKLAQPATAAPMKTLPGQALPPQMQQGLAAALTPMMQPKPDAGTLRRWRLGQNG